ncbi:MAG TPA: hypothetical protein PLP65_09920 [Bacteroidales bacterium]|jgi:hypothetical protein|nr:hypothetical protein [Bacteroidales bacterium]
MLVKKLFFSLLIAAFAILFSCNDSVPPSNSLLVDSSETESDLQKTAVKVPSPIELYIFMYNADAKYAKENLNSIDNHSKYISKHKKALNLGIYASDLAYCTVFKQNKETFSYFSVTKKMADELGLTEGFDEKIVKRIDQNMSNSDSLYQISNDSYATAVRFLEQQGKEDLLPLMVTGAWIESVNLAIKSVPKFDANNEIVVRIADQGLLLENILELFQYVKDDPEFKEIMDKLLDLQQSYDKLLDNTDVAITQKQYEEIVMKVKAIRALFIA